MSVRDNSTRIAAQKVDAHVGERIRARRVEMGLTQSDLALKLDLSYQQMQKYETGGNRISAGRLWQLSKILQVDIGYFFEGVDESKLLHLEHY